MTFYSAWAGSKQRQVCCYQPGILCVGHGTIQYGLPTGERKVYFWFFLFLFSLFFLSEEKEADVVRLCFSCQGEFKEEL